jgi:heptosyltransferase-3
LKILLCKLNHLGDTLLLSSTLRHLRAVCPEARLEVLVRRGCEAALEGNPDVDAIWTVPGPEGSRRGFVESWKDFVRTFRGVAFQRYDWAFDLTNSDRSKFWIVLSMARNRVINTAYLKPSLKHWLFNRRIVFDWAHHHQVQRDYRTVSEFFPGPEKAPELRYIPAADMPAAFSDLPKTYAVFHPVSRWSFKEWPQENWSILADRVRGELGWEVIFSSGPGSKEQEKVEFILKGCRLKHRSTQGALRIPETARLIADARVFVGVDTFAMHLAAAVGTPVVALFGPSSEISWGPWRCPSRVICGPCPCKQTRQFTCDKSRPYPCMQAIRVEEVFESLSTF